MFLVSSHCWWHASSEHTGPKPQVTMLRALQRGWIACGSCARVDEIVAVATAFVDFYAHGLLVLHEPAGGAYLFFPQARARFISLQFPSVQIMLFCCRGRGGPYSEDPSAADQPCAWPGRHRTKHEWRFQVGLAVPRLPLRQSLLENLATSPLARVSWRAKHWVKR